MNNGQIIKVLVTEDEEDARELFKDILAAGGFDVITAVNGQDAQEKLAANPVDIVVLDIIMPVVDGIQALAEIKGNPGKFGTPKVIMLSNIAGDVAIEKAMELGADGYILKTSIEPADLTNTLRSYLSEQNSQPQDIPQNNGLDNSGMNYQMNSPQQAQNTQNMQPNMATPMQNAQYPPVQTQANQNVIQQQPISNQPVTNTTNQVDPNTNQPQGQNTQTFQ